MKNESSSISQRCLRVGEEVRRTLSSIFQEKIFRTQGLDAFSITVTEVKMSPDLQVAKVYVLPLGGSDAQTLLPLLKQEASSLRYQLGSKLQLRVVPTLVFFIDTLFDQVDHITSIFQNPKVQQDLQKEKDEDDNQSH
jgi:ribosome-binding factor A